jgi:hypothetical protein
MPVSGVVVVSIFFNYWVGCHKEDTGRKFAGDKLAGDNYFRMPTVKKAIPLKAQALAVLWPKFFLPVQPGSHDHVMLV